MPLDVWLNGSFVPLDDARVSAFDAGFQHAVGVFETIAARNGRLFRGEAHLDRMANTVRSLRLSSQFRPDPLYDAVEQTLARNNLKEARIRITITGGDLNLLPKPDGTKPGVSDPTILIVAQPPTKYPDAFFADGVLIAIARDRLNPFDSSAGHKTMNYWSRLLALQHAAATGAAEALWLLVTNHLGSGSVSNLFLVKDGALLTPIARGEEERVMKGELNPPDQASDAAAESTTGATALPAPVLPGITRAAIIELAGEMNLPVYRRMLTIEDLLAADEVFLTNSSWQVLPVVNIEQATVGKGSVGPETKRLRAKLLDLMQAETTGD